MLIGRLQMIMSFLGSICVTMAKSGLSMALKTLHHPVTVNHTLKTEKLNAMFLQSNFLVVVILRKKLEIWKSYRIVLNNTPSLTESITLTLDSFLQMERRI